MAALPTLGQVTLTGDPITIVDATLDGSLPPPQPSVPSRANPYGPKVTLGDTTGGKTVIGKIQRVAVVLPNLSHSYLADVDVLLEGPGGKKVILMSDVAVGMGVSGAEITISPAGTANFPESGLPGVQLPAGVYKPTDFGPTEIFDAPAPAGPYDTDFSVFNGGTGKGDWKLYVMDDRRLDAGTIGGWQLKLWFSPVVSVTNSAVTTDEDTLVDIPVKVEDLDTAIGNITVTAVSSDETLITNKNLTVTAPTTGNEFRLKMLGNPDKNGTVTITIRANDGITTETIPITLTINPKNDRPTVNSVKIAGVSTNAVKSVQGSLSPAYTINISDIDLPPQTLTAFGESADTNIVRAADIVFLDGAGADRTFYVAPKGASFGSTTLRLFAKDSDGSNSVPFEIPFQVAQVTDRRVFANFHSIELADGTGATNSATISVSDVKALTGKIIVTLANVTHPKPSDLEAWVVGPTGVKVVLIAKAGGANPVTNGRLVFDSVLGAPLSETGPLIPPGTLQAVYKPGDFAGGPTPDLGAFSGTDPTGNWTVYLIDRVAGDKGKVDGGVILSILTRPVFATIADQVRDEDSAEVTLPFTVNDWDGVVKTVTAAVSSGDASIVALTTTFTADATSGTLKVKPNLNKYGLVTITLTATDNSGYTGTTSFKFEVKSVNDLPTITPISKQITYVGQPPAPTTFDVSDIETPLASLTVSARSSNTKLLPDGNISVEGLGVTRTLRMFPVGTEPGIVDITVTVRDLNGGESSRTFRLDVLSPASPLFVNATEIQFRDTGIGGPPTNGLPNPSTITVSGLVGKISKIKVNLVGVTHPNPNDLDILLIGPGGQKVMLMSDVGGTTPADNVQLVFDDGATDGPLTGSGTLISGVYKPIDFDGGDADVFIPSTVTKPVPNNELNVFNGLDPNAPWSLFVMDDTGNSAGDDKVGVIAGGWMLLIQTEPVLTGIPGTVTTTEDKAVDVSFDIGDDQPGIPTTFEFTANSNPTLIDTSKITFSEGGDKRTMRILPQADQYGEANLTLVVTVGGKRSNSSSFKVVVTPVNDAPTVTGIADNVSVPVGLILGPINFTVSDKESAASTLIVTATSSNPALPNSSLVLGGSDGARTLTVLPPAGTEAVASTITITVTDPQGEKGGKAVGYSSTRSVSFANGDRIDILDNSRASSYPSIINVKGVAGAISNVRVTLNGFTHSFPDDVHVLLVKGDKSTILLGNAGGGAPTNSVSDLTIGLDDAAAMKIGDETKLASGSFRPGNWGSPSAPSAVSPNPNPPSAPYQEVLSTFNGLDANGDWKLYIWDDTPTDAGFISRGWTIVISTAPRIVDVPTQRGTEDIVHPVQITLEDQDTSPTLLTLEAEVEAVAAGSPSVINNASLKFDPATTNLAVRTLLITPLLNVSGTITNTVKLTVSDGTTTSSKTFKYSAAPVDDPPLITTATNRVIIDEDTTSVIVFEISDVDSRLDKTNIVVTSTNEDLVAVKNISLTGPTDLSENTKGTVTVTSVPTLNAFGDTVLNVSITDKVTRVGTNVTLQVTAVNDTPTISSIPDQTGDKGVQAGGIIRDLVFKVTDVETDAKSLVVTSKARITGTDTPASSLPDSNLFISESGTNRVLALQTIGTSAESVTVTLTVSDGNKSASTTFLVEVKAAQPVPGTVFARTNPMEIRDLSSTNSSILVSGLAGRVYKLYVTLGGLSHTAPEDVDVMLKAPDGRGVILMSDAGGSIPANNLRLEFLDDAPNGLLRDDGPLTSGSFSPSNFGSDPDTFPGSGVTTFVANLAAFNGIIPNGNWTLYIVDDQLNDAGNLAQGWSIKVVTTPTIVLDNLFVPPGSNFLDYNEDTVATTRLVIEDGDLPLATIDGYSILTKSSNSDRIQDGKIVVNKAFGSVPVVITPESNQYDETTNLLTTVTIRRNSDQASASLVITNVIRAVNDAPELTRTTDRTTTRGVPLTDLFVTVSDQPEPSSSNPIRFEASSSNTSVVSHTNILLNGISNVVYISSGERVQVVVVPNSDAAIGGAVSTMIELKATDNNSTATAKLSNVITDGFGRFKLTVLPQNDAPTIGAIADQFLEAGATKSLTITVADPDDTAGIKVTGKSLDQTLVRDGTITVTPETGGTGSRTLSFRAELAVQGKTVIELTVEDSKGAKTTRTLNVTVTPSRERRYEGKNLVIRDLNSADPYPSIISIDDLVGNVAKIRVDLVGFAHGYPDDVDMVLVSPKGTKVMLMSDAGGSTGVTNLNITFDQAASTAIPDAGPLTSGSFRPANHDVVNDPFPGGPASPFETDLTKFNGEGAKGEWKLYVVDDTRQDAGVINGWAIYITTAPKIDGLVDVSIDEDEPFEVPFTIVEESFATSTFKFGFASTNPAVVAPAGLSVSQIKGDNYLLSGVPVRDAFGKTEITVYGTNDFGQVASGKFQVAVASVNDHPFITEVAPVFLVSGEASSGVSFDYGDAETAKKDMDLRITTSDAALVPTNNVYVIGNILVIAPVGNRSGIADITITVADATGLTASTSFRVTVTRALQAQFANTNIITIRDNQTATPYPSTINVAGVKGKVSKVTVTLAQLYHNYPADIDILLVGPGDKKVVLMSDVGGGRAVNPTRLTLDDGDANTPFIPYNPPTPVAMGTYKPTNAEGSGDVWPPSAPSGPYTYVLSTFAGIDPNGDWSLYVVDDVSPDAGRIDGGWILNLFTTEPSIGPIADQSTLETVPVTVAFQVADSDTPLASLTATASTDRPSLLSVGPVQGTGRDRTVVITPVGFQNGVGNVTIELSDGTSTVSSTFMVTVVPVNQPPSIVGLTNTSTPSNRTLSVPFVVTDNETAAADIVVGATIERTEFGSVDVTGDTANRVLTFRPSGEKGETLISVVANDGELSTTNSFLIAVGEPYALTISEIADQMVDENGSKIVPFTVSGSETGNVTVTAAIGDPTKIAKVDIIGSGGSWSANVFTVAGANGSSMITLTATDEFGSGVQDFSITIVPIDDPPVLGELGTVTTFANINANVRTTVTDPDTASSDLIFSWASSNPTLVRNVLFSLVGTSELVITIIPERDQVGESSVTIFVADATSRIGQPLLLRVVTRPNEPPVLAPIADQSTPVNVPAFVRLNVTDPDTEVPSLTIVATAANQTLVQSITTGFGTDGTPVLNVRPRANEVGQSAIQVTVNDGLTTVSRSFILTVFERPNDPPVFGSITEQSTPSNVALTLPVPVTDPDTALADLVLTSSVSNSGVIQSVTFANDGTTVTATITPVSGSSGVSAVTFTANDGNNTVSTTFAVQVTAPSAPKLSVPTLTTNADGTQTITVTWQNGGELEWAPTTMGPWTKTGNTSGTYSETVTSAPRFFRVGLGS